MWNRKTIAASLVAMMAVAGTFAAAQNTAHAAQVRKITNFTSDHDGDSARHGRDSASDRSGGMDSSHDMGGSDSGNHDAGGNDDGGNHDAGGNDDGGNHDAGGHDDNGGSDNGGGDSDGGDGGNDRD